MARLARQSWRRESLLANPDAIALAVEQITDGHVFVAERDGVIVGFVAVVPRPDGNAELDALFVDPSLWKRGVGRLLVEHCAGVAAAVPRAPCTSSVIRTRKASMPRAASARQGGSTLDSAPVSRCAVSCGAKSQPASDELEPTCGGLAGSAEALAQ